MPTSCPVVYDQKHMGSCTANAVAGAFEFISMKQGLPFSPSRLFIWYYARQMSGDRHAVLKNVGSCIRHTVASLSKNLHGVCSESDWSYEEGQYDEKTKFFINHAKAAKKPPPLAVQNAHKHTAVKYYSITKENRLYKLKKRLDDGYPFLFSLTPCDGLHELGPDSDYKLKLPTTQQQKTWKGRHSLLAVGYDQSEKIFIVRNSWGAGWGKNGYFYMPYKYLDYCFDFWTITLVKN